MQLPQFTGGSKKRYLRQKRLTQGERERRSLVSRKKTLVRTLVINAVPQGYVEAVVAATLCSNFIHVTCGGQ